MVLHLQKDALGADPTAAYVNETRHQPTFTGVLEMSAIKTMLGYGSIEGTLGARCPRSIYAATATLALS